MSFVSGTGDRLAGADLVEDPYPFYARLRREAPVWRAPGTEAFLVSTWGLVAEAVGRVEDFSNKFRRAFFTEDDGSVGVLELGGGDAAPDVFAGADPPAHTAHRALFFPELVQQKVQALEGEVSAPLARIEARVVLTRLLERTRQFALDARCPPRWAESLWSRRHQLLPITLEAV